MLISHDANEEMVSGSEKSLLQLGAALQKKSLEVIWISPRKGLSVLRAKQMGMQTGEFPFSLLWSLIHNPRQIGNELKSLQTEASHSRLAQTIARHRPDLLVTNSVINVLPALIGDDQGIPVWWYIHEVLPLVPEIELLQPLFRLPERILAPSPAVAHRLRSNAEESVAIEVFPYGVQIPNLSHCEKRRQQIRTQYGWPETSVVAGWFGSIYHGKGMLDYVRAALQINENPEWVFVAAGNVVDPGYLHSCLQEACQHSSFQYLGVFANIDEILPAVDLVVIPSLVEESFPNIALEAMAYGKCVLAYESGGLKEIVRHNATGMLVPKGDIQSLSLSMKDLMQNAATRNIMGYRGRKQVKKQYKLQVFEKRIEKLLEWASFDVQSVKGGVK